MKVVIVEDEHLAAEKLAGQLQRVVPGVEVLKTLESVEEAVNWFGSNPAPDLVFMDIQLEDGISFEIFEAIKLQAPVIFTTAYDEYAIRAFKVNSVDYLLKPIDEEDLKKAIQKFRKIFDETEFASRVTRVIEQVSKKYKTRFFMKIGTHFRSVKVTEICCFFVQERNTFLRTTTGKTYDIDHSLD
jgi:DNA-binding LytR/AlgR family response regulator